MKKEYLLNIEWHVSENNSLLSGRVIVSCLFEHRIRPGRPLLLSLFFTVCVFWPEQQNKYSKFEGQLLKHNM